VIPVEPKGRAKQLGASGVAAPFNGSLQGGFSIACRIVNRALRACHSIHADSSKQVENYQIIWILSVTSPPI
jgi:hypothetical protein